jgi:two-component system response regulator NreC
VIVMDLSMPDMDGLTATRELQKANAARVPNPDEPATRRVLVLTMHTEDEHLVSLLEAGAGGYLLKSVADRELVDAVRTVAAGDVYVQPTAARALARGLAKRDGNAEERARVSPKTVDTYKQRIGEKLGLTHRTDYVKFALKLGLLKNEM